MKISYHEDSFGEHRKINLEFFYLLSCHCHIWVILQVKGNYNTESVAVITIQAWGTVKTIICRVHWFSTLRPRQNGRHFAGDIFKGIFLNETVWILIKISLKFVLKGPIDDIPALVQVMAWHRSGDMPVSEQMMARLPDACRHLASMS